MQFAGACSLANEQPIARRHCRKPQGDSAMSRIFISHASENNALAFAIGRWLADHGWDD